jgi:hypothetical protein
MSIIKKISPSGGSSSGDSTRNASYGLDMVDTELVKTVMKDYGEAINNIGSVGGGTQDIDLENGNVVLASVDTSTTTFTFSNPPVSGVAGSFKLVLSNGGSQTVNWPTSVKWPSDTEPSWALGGYDIITFITYNGGSTWFGTNEAFPDAVDYMSATGGTITYDGDYKIHTFNSGSTFNIAQLGTNITYGDKIEYLVIGGGGGAAVMDGGGGAGGYIFNAAYDLTVTAIGYAVAVGAGGSGANGSGTNNGLGTSSTFHTITAGGGGGGGHTDAPGTLNGGTSPVGSGGGGGRGTPGGAAGGTGGGSGTYGSNGGIGSMDAIEFSTGGGGGGAGAVGGDANTTTPGNGGAGVSSSITGASVYRGGGGGGGSYDGDLSSTGVYDTGYGTGGVGGGGTGTYRDSGIGSNGAANTGGGAGGWKNPSLGGSGVVIIRYKYK